MDGTREVIPLEDVAKMPAPGLSSPANVSFSPDGRIVAFLHASGAQNGLSRQLYALDVATRRVALLAAPPNKGNTEGNLSLEEKLRRERQRQMGVGITSYAWSPSLHSQRLLYPLQGDLYVQEKPGDELQLLFDKTSTDQSLGVQRLNRLQTEVTFLRFDPLTGRATKLIQESSPVWINANYLFRAIEAESNNSFRFLWGSERTGFMHIYLYEYTAGASAATLLGAVTTGNWSVESVEGIDLANGLVYICGTADSPLERHLYVAPIIPMTATPLHPKRLTGAEGMHSIVMDSSCRMFVDVYSNPTTPPRALVCTVPSKVQISAVNASEPADPTKAGVSPAPFSVETATLFQGILDSAFPLTSEQEDLRVAILQAQGKLCVPKIISVPTRDGHDTLYGAVYLPDPEIHGPGPYPTIVSVYGGPHVQRVARMWAMTVDMRVQRFRDMGYAVLKVDNRGSFRRGSAFEGAIKHHMGTVEIQDQEDAVQQLVRDGITIEGRVGIYGWSYGGYMSAISLMKAPNTFKLAIAGAPVTSWDGYDTCYTERYMSTPQLNPQGYREGSVMESVSNMKKGQKLMLIHGLIDENVHFRHTARLITSLINTRKHYDLLLFPGERHSPRHLEDRIYMEQRIAEYVEANL
ncbi:hypothetical protein BBO99_00007005 [Phytophthora kernoviae]|uniref:Peptidase S9 prolyl oligopeptidase catalytic domain-containing protein n=2 Tax=Phytophthora kernoviae TaxID=325452 RepID=A0A3R7J5A1_9STRA|nr:hypothetical protein G195_007637 [Phytophthora kernoviae 00238/432]KAG2521182.1 hypothetical protein JM18_006698 [Phytophthora kernoviae]KAG2529430.1 hypothetical protein JM16_000791 [Phytophthora kernoviae]RLN05944.1 hypothetical protein BBI17_005018 [Phytophthora kernoviae]RLN77117.1 hypothetical protein BBO99_00007005 [Phytophthora kernoviae]